MSKRVKERDRGSLADRRAWKGVRVLFTWLADDDLVAYQAHRCCTFNNGLTDELPYWLVAGSRVLTFVQQVYDVDPPSCTLTDVFGHALRSGFRGFSAARLQLDWLFTPTNREVFRLYVGRVELVVAMTSKGLMWGKLRDLVELPPNYSMPLVSCLFPMTNEVALSPDWYRLMTLGTAAVRAL